MVLQKTFISIEHTKAVSNILFYKLFILNRKDEFFVHLESNNISVNQNNN